LRLFIEFFLSTNTRAGETPAQDPSLNVPVLLLLDEFLALGRVNRLVQALSYVRGWGIKIATVIQSEAQLHAVYGRDMAEFYIDNHGARVYYRPPLHRRDSAEQLSRVVGQRTVRQTSVSAGHGTRSRQVSKTGQAVLDPDEIAHLPERDILVLVDGIRPFLARKLCYFRDRLFRPRAAMGALALPAPLTGELPDAPTLRSEPSADDALGDSSDTAEPVENAIERASPDPSHYEPAVDVSALIARVRAMNPAPDDPAIAEVANQFVRASPALRAA
jgi:type IV secretion system protein VirD4